MRSITVTREKIKLFDGQSVALLIWSYAMACEDNFTFRTAYFKDTIIKCSDDEWKRAIAFLKEEGLIKQRYYRNQGGTIGSEYIVSFEKEEKRETQNEAQKVSPRNVFLSSYNEDHTSLFLRMFPSDQTFLTFDDKKKTRLMNKVFKGYNFVNQMNMKEFNKKGAGVFLTINETDGKGRKTKNITKVRAVFINLDGSPIELVLKYNPHIITESSPGIYHVYWLVQDVPLNKFTQVQKSIACLFNVKSSICDLPRVMRVPGFMCNTSNTPFMTRVVSTLDTPKYTYEEIKLMFPGK